MLPQDKTYIKNNLCKVNPVLVDTWMQSLTHIRNQCAHYGRLYNTLFPKIAIKKEDRLYELNNKMIFTYIMAMKYLIADKTVWNKFFINLQQLMNEHRNSIKLDLIGFPENWIEILSKK